MANIKCTKCGKKIENVTNGIVECSNCGHKMKYTQKKSKTEHQSENHNTKARNNDNKAVKTPRLRKKQGCLFYFLLGIMVILFLAIIIGLTQSSKDKGTKQNVPHRENIYGVSDKNIDDIDKKLSVTDVISDVTGKWKLARIADNIDIEEYALSYYNKYFESDDEIHAVINFNYKTTTKISVLGDVLDVVIHEYVDKEELDASTLFGGMVYEEFHIYLDNGDMVKIGTNNASDGENVSIDVTPENFISDIRNLDVISEDESITDIRLENRDLCLSVDLSKANVNASSLPLEKQAKLLTFSITDEILTLIGYDDLWDTITIDFGDKGKITNSKANMETTENGRYFVGNPELE